MLSDIPEPEKFITETLASLPKWNTLRQSLQTQRPNKVTDFNSSTENIANGIVFKLSHYQNGGSKKFNLE